MNTSEKEQIEKLKALRREIEEKLEEQLPPEMLDGTIPKVEVQKITGDEALEPEQAKQVIEALLFAATKPLTVQEIRKVVKSLTSAQITKMIKEMQQELIDHPRSFELIEVANGYEFATKKEFAPWIMKIELQKKAKQVTLSALETLAILAYKQPITRPEIEGLRGVDVSGVLNTLIERDMVRIVGRKEVPGRPFLYGTTEKFLEHFGLKSLDELPNLEDIKTLVESSVRKEELLGTRRMIDVGEEKPQEVLPSANGHSQAETNGNGGISSNGHCRPSEESGPQENPASFQHFNRLNASEGPPPVDDASVSME